MKRIVITGPKSSGKSHIGSRYAELVHLPFFDLDEVIEELFEEEEGIKLTFREIYRRHGESAFRKYEERAARKVASMDTVILSTGGTTFTLPILKDILLPDSYVIFLHNDKEVLWDRTIRKGLPSFLEGVENPKEAFFERVARATAVIEPVSDLVLDTNDLTIEEVAQMLDVELMQRKITFGKKSDDVL